MTTDELDTEPLIHGFDATYNTEALNTPDGATTNVRVPIRWDPVGEKPSGPLDIIGDVTGPDGFTTSISANYTSEWDEGGFGGLLMTNGAGEYTVAWHLVDTTGTRTLLRTDTIHLTGDEDDDTRIAATPTIDEEV